jgi:SAM-dependent methyltransferase
LLPNWRERLVCQECGLNAKLRAMLHVLAEVVVPGRDPRLLVWELGSELAEAARSRYGAVTAVSGIRQKLESFESERFDCLLVVDVLERVENPDEAIAACLGSLKPGGGMVFTAAFSRRRLRGRERTETDSDAPRRTFGWSLLDAFRDAGFEDVAAHFFWSRPFAYLGGEQVVFAARKGAASG